MWSPDGKEVAVTDAVSRTDRVLWIVGKDGRGLRKVAAYQSETYGSVSWTPDGATLIFAGYDGRHMQIYSVPRDGGTPRKLTNGTSNILNPIVSPDGRWIACSHLETTETVQADETTMNAVKTGLSRRSLLALGLAGAACSSVSLRAASPANDGGKGAGSSPAVKTGGARMVSIGGKHQVWVKQVAASRPSLPVLTLHGGPGFPHFYFECFEDFLPAAGISYWYYDQLGCGFSDQPDDTSLWTIERFTQEIEAVRAELGLGAHGAARPLLGWTAVHRVRSAASGSPCRIGYLQHDSQQRQLREVPE